MYTILFGSLIFLAIAAIVYVAIKYFTPKGKVCPKCQGKGWWMATRGKETCDYCGGIGRVPKAFPDDL